MIIAISGRINSGKDTIGRIIQYLTSVRNYDKTFKEWEEISKTTGRYYAGYSNWQIKKFADKLKDIVCILLNCTKEQLEDREFKEKELGEEWWYWKENITCKIIKPYTGYEINDYNLIKLTPRLLLQLLGTDCGRNIIHPNIWVNALFADYKVKWVPTGDSVAEEDVSLEKKYPNWIITDMRFPNEMEAVKKRGGITIRVNRGSTQSTQYERYLEFCKTSECTYNDLNSEQYPMSFDLFNRQSDNFKNRFLVEEHESETALDNAEFDYEIDNNKDILYLISEVRKILEKENLI